MLEQNTHKIQARNDQVFIELSVWLVCGLYIRMIHSHTRPRTWQDLLGEDTSSHTFCFAWIHLFISHFPRISEGQNTVSAVSAGEGKRLPRFMSMLTERSACEVRDRAGASSQTWPPENRGLSYLLGGRPNKFEQGSGIQYHTKFIAMFGQSLF